MDLHYTLEQTSVTNSIQACFNANGLSGNALVCGVGAKESAVQTFLTTVVANIQTVRETEAVDNQAITTLLANYQSEDFDWLNANTFAPTYTLNADQLAELSVGCALVEWLIPWATVGRSITAR
jgi:hypothetical protein